MIKDDLKLSDLPRRIGDLPRGWAQRTPEALALRQGDIVWNWAEFSAAITQASDLLTCSGVRAGDRVMVVCENDRVAAAMLFAITDLDAWAILVNARLSDREVDAFIKHSQPRRVLFTTRASRSAAAHAKRYKATAQFTPLLDGFEMGTLNVASTPEPVFERSDEQIAVLIYTSGTSGDPKGVMLTHRSISYVARAARDMREITQDDDLLLALPMSHIMGLASAFLGAVTSGASVELVTRFDPAHLIAGFARGVSIFNGPPLMFAQLLDHLKSRKQKLKAPRIRFISAGGSTLDMSLKQDVEQSFGVPLNNGYGITECASTVAQTINSNPHSDETVGSLIKGLEARVVDSEGHDVEPHAVGTLLVRGPTVMQGYYRNQTSTSNVLDSEGWFNTGDLARFDTDACLYIVGRSKELIIRSGFNVYPAEVESVLTTHPSVIASAVVGRTVPGNEEVIAFVQLKEGKDISSAEISQFAARNLTAYKRPSKIFVLDELPTGSTGKIKKSKLAVLAANAV